jgi:hypothetical protein
MDNGLTKEQAGEAPTLVFGDIFQTIPECIFKADARLVVQQAR